MGSWYMHASLLCCICMLAVIPPSICRIDIILIMSFSIWWKFNSVVSICHIKLLNINQTVKLPVKIFFIIILYVSWCLHFVPEAFLIKNLVTKLHFIVVNWSHPAFTSLRHFLARVNVFFFCPTSCGVYINRQNSNHEKLFTYLNLLFRTNSFQIIYWKPTNISNNVWHNWTFCSLLFLLKKNACDHSPKRLVTAVSCFAVVGWQLFTLHTYC